MSTTTGPKTYTWISLWIAITIPVIFWDAGYCFMRPRSMEGGDLHWIWSPYSIYQNVDLVYGVKALEEGDGFTNAQSLLNLVENAMNIFYIYLAHFSSSAATNANKANLLAFTAATMTLSKTVLYWAQEYYCGWCATKQNSFKDLVVYWIVPNGFWIVVPAFVVLTLGKELVSQLNVASQAQAAGFKSKAVPNGKSKGKVA